MTSSRPANAAQRSLQALPAAAASPDTARLDLGGSLSLRPVVRGLIFAALFVAAMTISIDLVRFGGNVTPIWIASSILAWALIAAPTRDWPVIVGLAVTGHVIRAIIVGERFGPEAFYLATNLSAPLVCAALLRWRGDTLDFEDRASTLRFLLIAGVAAPAAPSAIVVLGSFLEPRRFVVDDIGIWFLADAIGLVVFLPIFKSLASGGWRDLLKPAVRVRSLLLFAGLFVLLASEWVLPANLRQFQPTLLVPYLVFMVFELGSAGARGAIAASTVMLLVYAIAGPGLARSGATPIEYIFTVQIYIAALVAILLPLAAALDEKQKLYETTSDALAEAQAAWGDLIAAEAHYRLIADNTVEMILRLDRDGAVIFASPACRLLAADTDALQGKAFPDLADGEDAAKARDVIATALRDGAVDRPHTIRIRLRRAASDPTPFDLSLTLIAAGNQEPQEFIAVLREVLQ